MAIKIGVTLDLPSFATETTDPHHLVSEALGIVERRIWLGETAGEIRMASYDPESSNHQGYTAGWFEVTDEAGAPVIDIDRAA